MVQPLSVVPPKASQIIAHRMDATLACSHVDCLMYDILAQALQTEML